MRKLFAFAVAAALLAFAAGANAANTMTNNLSYEFDNGTSWTLQKNTAALKTTYDNPGYSDAGIVFDLGPAADFDGLSWEGTDSLAANIWLGDGSQAYTPGTHLLSAAVDFSYGPWGGTFWTGPAVGQPVNTTYIQSLGADVEVYAWVGVVYNGVDDVSGSVSSVNGQSVGNRTFSFTNNGDDTVTAIVH